MTDQEMKEIEARLAAATAGLWCLIEDEHGYEIIRNKKGLTVIEPAESADERTRGALFFDAYEHDMNLVINAATDIRRLVDEVERLRKDNEELQKLVDKFSEANGRLRIAVTNRKEGKFYENP